MTAAALRLQDVTLGYGRVPVLDRLTLEIPKGRFTALIGPNGCGKSTLLKALIRALPLRAGLVEVAGLPLARHSARSLARAVAFLPQVLPVPEGITVRELAGHGRSPHNGAWGRMRASDRAAVDAALDRLDLGPLAETPLEALSGGQRQRVWLAMVLAQDTPVLLLDEPTTYLDIAHQVEVLELARSLVAAGRTVVAVLHDLNQAFRYADHLAVLQGGRLVCSGPPAEVATSAMLEAVFNVRARIEAEPETGAPMMVVRRPEA